MSRTRTAWRRFSQPTAAVALCVAGDARAAPADDARLVRRALVEMFVNRDVSAPARYFSLNYVQHNPRYGSGRDVLERLIRTLPKDFRYEPGLTVAQGGLVMVHGRYSGAGSKPAVAVDIYRVRDERIVEHWDVLQEEVPPSGAKSGQPMFAPGER